MKTLRQALALALCGMTLAACGGGGGSSSDALRQYKPRVQVSGLSGGEQVVFTLGGQQITATGNTTYTRTDSLVGDYRAAVVTPPAGKQCLFNGSTQTYRGSAALITLVCGTGSGGGGGGGGGGPVSEVEGSFQHWPWLNIQKVTGAPIWIFPISLLDFENNGLTGATVSNFVFELGDRSPIIPGSEFRVFVQPITVGDVQLRATIAIDVSTSFTDAALETIKDQVADFLGEMSPNHIYRITTFDGVAVEAHTWADGGDPSVLQDAVQAIPVDGRSPATDIYSAAANAAQAVAPELETLDHIIIITDGEDFSTQGYNDFSDDLDHQMIFVVQVGDIHPDDQARLETLVQVGKDTTFPDRIVHTPGPGGVKAALTRVRQYMESMAGGLHHMWVGLPYEDDGEVRLTFSTNPREDCDAEARLGACGWYIDLDTSGSFVPSNTIFAIPNSVLPRPGDTVRFDIPRDWRLCSDNPVFTWGPLQFFAGSATGAASADGHSYQLTLGSGGPIDLRLPVVDAAAPACTGESFVLIP